MTAKRRTNSSPPASSRKKTKTFATTRKTVAIGRPTVDREASPSGMTPIANSLARSGKCGPIIRPCSHPGKLQGAAGLLADGGVHCARAEGSVSLRGKGSTREGGNHARRRVVEVLVDDRASRRDRHHLRSYPHLAA